MISFSNQIFRRATLLLGAMLLIATVFISMHKTPEAPKPAPRFGIVLHGGAGVIKRENMSPERDKEYRDALELVLRHGYAMLENGKPALDVVEYCIRQMENSPLFNAGVGAVLTHAGKNELDASIMDGSNLMAGAVAGISTVKNPISAARAVMEHSPHVMLSGTGAEAFAGEQGLDIVPSAYFSTPRRVKQLERLQKRESEKKENSSDRSKDQGSIEKPDFEDHKFGTVGVAVLDLNGNLAAGTSTGGMTNKRWGRIGDSPVIGAGTYADNNTCAISCTGHGEFFIRYAVAHDVSAMMEYKKASLSKAANHVIKKKLVDAGGTGGLIGIDAKCNIVMSFNTPGMFRASMREGETPFVGIYEDE